MIFFLEKLMGVEGGGGDNMKGERLDFSIHMFLRLSSAHLGTRGPY